MSDNVLYLRGDFSISGPPINEEVMKDVRVLIDLSPDTLKSLAEDIAGFDGFLDGETVHELVNRHVSEPPASKSLARFIGVFGQWLCAPNRSVDALLRQMEAWLRSDENKQSTVSVADVAAAHDRMRQILGPFPGQLRHAKAERLSTATGQPLESIEIICDVRPVFDDNRNSIEGMLPYTIMRMVCKGADGLPIALEAVLSDRDVRGLVEAAKKAEQKLARIRATIAAIGIAVPTTYLTRQEVAGAT